MFFNGIGASFLANTKTMRLRSLDDFINCDRNANKQLSMVSLQSLYLRCLPSHITLPRLKCPAFLNSVGSKFRKIIIEYGRTSEYYNEQ
ncbi:MAG: hypothetical protein LBB21_01840 [Holosporaceae bacterium]|jgi:hypothetical protein|nr:hypothetical protein [Holosporaceae bacterium]